MATISHEVADYRKKDGTYAIRIRLIHNRKAIRKPSGIYANASQLTRDKTKIKDMSLLRAVNAAVERLRLAAAHVDGAEFMTCEQLWRCIAARMEHEKGFSLDFFAFSQTVIAKKGKGTSDGYKFAMGAFGAFLGKDSIDINAIDRNMVVSFREWIEKRNGKGCRASSAYLEKLRHIHNAARDIYNDTDTGLVRIPREPFKGVIPPQPPSRHRALTLEQLRAVFASRPKTARGKLALDVFRLSFCLVGINTADLYGIKKSDLRDGVLTYQRQKVRDKRADNAEISIRVEPEATALIEAWKGQKLLLSFSERYCDFKGFNKAVDKGLKEVGKLVGIPALTSYYARHTWATLARNEAGIDKDTVHEALDHASRGADKVTDIYIKKDFSRIWEANRKVLDLLK